MLEMLASMIAMSALAQGPTAEAACLDLKGNQVIPLSRLANPKPKATVLIFYLASCPIAQKMTPEINRLYKEFSPKGVQFYLIHEDLTMASNEVQKHATEYGLLPAILIDKWRTQMKRSGATISPEAAVYDSGLRETYRGRINDLFYGLGKMKPAATQHDLRDAILGTLSGKVQGNANAPAVGCILPKG